MDPGTGKGLSKGKDMERDRFNSYMFSKYIKKNLFYLHVLCGLARTFLWMAGGPRGRWNILQREWLANLKLFLLLIPLIIMAALLEACVTHG
jgi:hypothetical protein